MVIPDLALSWWWLAFCTTSVLVVAFTIPGMLWKDQKVQKTGSKTQHQQSSLREAPVSTMPKSTTRNRAKEEDIGDIRQEPWIPEVMIKEWREAGQFFDCPWCFEGCDNVEDVIHSIWGRTATSKGLQQSLNALIAKVKNVRVAKVNYRMTGDVYWAALYTLHSNAEIFGCQPLDHSVGVDLDCDVMPGLRRRRGNGSENRGILGEVEEIALPCLAPFYRIHDGFGCLLSHKHLAILLANPHDNMGGSCFYVYPNRCLTPLKLKPSLLKFARVDKNCVACASSRDEHPNVVFAEHNGQLTDDDECPLDFCADTVCNIAGQKVVPGEYGQYGYGSY
mmetsp:Transcript_88230/g.139432  ORF Transcript_88230/g.139432 Transcript_88230/m.139432 type:complete len:335 (+) Transcript_88230:59-1063(+)